jgi:hypothetical protein
MVVMARKPSLTTMRDATRPGEKSVRFRVPCGDTAHTGKSGAAARRGRCFLAQVSP